MQHSNYNSVWPNLPRVGVGHPSLPFVRFSFISIWKANYSHRFLFQKNLFEDGENTCLPKSIRHKIGHLFDRELSVNSIFISVNNLYLDIITWANTTYVATHRLQEAYGIKYKDGYFSKFAKMRLRRTNSTLVILLTDLGDMLWYFLLRLISTIFSAFNFSTKNVI